MNPHNDALAASWLGGNNNPKPEPKQFTEPAETYSVKDENWYRIQAIYGDQTPTPRPRRGRKTMADPTGAGFGLAWKAAKDVGKCDGNCDCPDCGSKKKPTEEKGSEK